MCSVKSISGTGRLSWIALSKGFEVSMMNGVNFGRCGVRVREVLELLCRLIPACRLLNLVWNQCHDLYTTSVVNRSYTMIIILFYISVSVVQRSTDSTCEMKRKRKRLGRRNETFADANARIMQDVLL